MRQCLLGTLVVRRLDKGFIGLPGTGFRGDIGAEIANDVATFVDVRRGPVNSLAVEKMRASAFQSEKRRIVHGSLVDLAGVLCDQLSNHLEMAELLKRDVLQHVADPGILDME